MCRNNGDRIGNVGDQRSPRTTISEYQWQRLLNKQLCFRKQSLRVDRDYEKLIDDREKERRGRWERRRHENGIDDFYLHCLQVPID